MDHDDVIAAMILCAFFPQDAYDYRDSGVCGYKIDEYVFDVCRSIVAMLA